MYSAERGEFLTLHIRACLGRNLAIMQLHIIFATLFRRYDFILKSDAPVGHAQLIQRNVADVVL